MTTGNPPIPPIRSYATAGFWFGRAGGGPGRGDSNASGRAGRGGPQPASWQRALHVLVDGRVDDEGPGKRAALNVHSLVAVDVIGECQREVLGLDVASGEDGAGWLAFLAVVDRPRPVRRVACDLRRSPRSRHPGRRRTARSQVAGVGPDQLPARTADQGVQADAAVDRHPGALNLRPTRRRRGPSASRTDAMNPRLLIPRSLPERRQAAAP